MLFILFVMQTDTSLHEFLDWFSRFAFPLLNVKRLFELVLNSFFSARSNASMKRDAKYCIGESTKENLNGAKWYSSRGLTRTYYNLMCTGRETDIHRGKQKNVEKEPKQRFQATPHSPLRVSCWTLCSSYFVTMGRFQGTWKENKHTHSVEKSNRFLQHNRLLIIEPNTFEVEQPTHINFSTQRVFLSLLSYSEHYKRSEGKRKRP